jgi:alkanesulfonate monooxygenase SsuD/methylene tetrahydromethanopterin reductase-like flavin-dependent oxidoreductase (luciferase family)
MQFGLFYEWPNPTLRNWKLLFEEGVQQIQYSEALGFDYCLIAEHHFTNYGNSPAPLMQALYIGQRTRRIRIGTAAVILPVWQPLRLAEEIAVLDNLIVGSPATVIEKFKRAASVGVTHVSNWMMFGGLEHEKLMRSIRLMGEEVIPALRDVHPPADLSDEILHETVTAP